MKGKQDMQEKSLNNTDLLNFSVIITRLERSLGLKTDAEFAEKLGISPNTIYGWKNRNHIDIQVLYKICKENNISLEWVLTGEEKPENPKNSNIIASDKEENYNSSDASMQREYEKLESKFELLEEMYYKLLKEKNK